jgi:flagellar biosynthesis protein FlhG
LGCLFARLGKKCRLNDLDLGAANLHALLDIFFPAKNFSDFIRKKYASLDSIVLETPVPDLFLISGANDALDIKNKNNTGHCEAELRLYFT